MYWDPHYRKPKLAPATYVEVGVGMILTGWCCAGQWFLRHMMCTLLLWVVLLSCSWRATDGLCASVAQRPATIKVKAQALDGSKISRSFKDPWAARIFQHEYDHLQGTLFPDRVAPGARSAILSDLRALEEDFLRRQPGADFRRYV